MEHRTCVIVGGGPAGMIAGLVLARSGVDVTVLEKHGDFLRDFRGDTVHPTTLQLLDELGLLPAFERIEHSRIDRIVLPVRGGGTAILGDLRRLKHPHPHIAIAPQWDFLDVLAGAGAREPHFRLMMNAEATGVLRRGARVRGVTVRVDGHLEELPADLVIAADGRWSAIRRAAGLPVVSSRVPIDVWWFRVPGSSPLVDSVLPVSTANRMFVAIPRVGYVQMAAIIPKGADAPLRALGIDSLRAAVGAAFPPLARAVETLRWDDVKLLDVHVDRLRRWSTPGLLCIGDAAHAMSPVGGVGVNLAVQDGVAAATMLADALRTGASTDRLLPRVQRRRAPAAFLTQWVQRAMHRVIQRVVGGEAAFALPRPVARIVHAFPALTVIPARILAVGVRPEHAPAVARRTADPAA